MGWLKNNATNILLWVVGPSSGLLLRVKGMTEYFNEHSYLASGVVWFCLSCLFWGAYRIIRRPSNGLTNKYLPNISFSYTLNENDCYIDPEQSCNESFTHAVAWEHNKDEDGALVVLSHSVALVFTHPRIVKKVELKSLNTNDTLEVIAVNIESCTGTDRHSGVNVLCSEDVGIERLKLTVYFND